MFSFIPLPVKIMFFIFLVAGAVSWGYFVGSSKSEAELAKFAARAADLEIKLKNEQNNIKEKVVTEYVDKIQKVKEKQYVYIEKAANIVPAQHDVSNGWVYLHDHVASAESGDADPARTSDETASGVKDNQALAVVVGNYSTCQQNTEQLKALQDYISKVKAAVDRANNNPVKFKN